jgi:hypothetical protein
MPTGQPGLFEAAGLNAWHAPAAFISSGIG